MRSKTPFPSIQSSEFPCGLVSVPDITMRTLTLPPLLSIVPLRRKGGEEEEEGKEEAI